MFLPRPPSAGGVTDVAAATAMSPGRVWSFLGVLVGVAGVVLGSRALARGAAVRGPRLAMAGLVAGTVALGLGAFVVATADGGPGTGYGIVGGFVSLAVGLVAVGVSALPLVRRCRVG